LNLRNVCELKKMAEKFLNDINIPVDFECK
jgi:uncharacterized protein YjiS (DUF1127 family)